MAIREPVTERKIRNVKIVVGDEWIEHRFGRDVDEGAARARLLVMIDSLVPPATPNKANNNDG